MRLRGTRSPKAIGLTNSNIGQFFSSACFLSSLSGLTATGLPTSYNIGISVDESEYAQESSREMFFFKERSIIASALCDPAA